MPKKNKNPETGLRDVKTALKARRGAMAEVARRSGVSLSTVSKVLDGLGTSANIVASTFDVLTEIRETGDYRRTEGKPRKTSVRAAIDGLRKKNGK